MAAIVCELLLACLHVMGAHRYQFTAELDDSILLREVDVPVLELVLLCDLEHLGACLANALQALQILNRHRLQPGGTWSKRYPHQLGKVVVELASGSGKTRNKIPELLTMENVYLSCMVPSCVGSESVINCGNTIHSFMGC